MFKEAQKLGERTTKTKEHFKSKKTKATLSQIIVFRIKQNFKQDLHDLENRPKDVGIKAEEELIEEDV